MNLPNVGCIAKPPNTQLRRRSLWRIIDVEMTDLTRNTRMLKMTSLISVMLFILHVTGDISLGYEKGSVYPVIPIALVSSSARLYLATISQVTPSCSSAASRVR